MIGPIFTASFTLALRAIIDYNTYEPLRFTLPIVALTASLLLLVLLRNKEFTFKKAVDYWIIPILAVFLSVFSYGTLQFFNCFYDTSAPQKCTAVVESKSIEVQKVLVFYKLRLGPWATRTEAEEVEVSHELYQSVERGQEVHPLLYQGKLGIPWFEVSK